MLYRHLPDGGTNANLAFYIISVFQSFLTSFVFSFPSCRFNSRNVFCKLWFMNELLCLRICIDQKTIAESAIKAHLGKMGRSRLPLVESHQMGSTWVFCFLVFLRFCTIRSGCIRFLHPRFVICILPHTITVMILCWLLSSIWSGMTFTLVAF